MWCKECSCLICAACGCGREHQGHYVKFAEKLQEEATKQLGELIETTSNSHKKALENCRSLGSAISDMEKVISFVLLLQSLLYL